MITSNDSVREEIRNLLQQDTQMLPEVETHDDLGDYVRVFDNGKAYTDIKTKIISLNSAPKAYNIDKFLTKMAEDDSLFFFFMLRIIWPY